MGTCGPRNGHDANPPEPATPEVRTWVRETCGRKAGYCAERKQARADTGPTKWRAGRRTIGLPAPLIKLLRTHRASGSRTGGRPPALA